MKIFSKYKSSIDRKNNHSIQERSNSESSLRKIFIALLSGTSFQFIVQIMSVPLLLHFLSFEQYSYWLLATNFAQITNILDLGTLASSQNSFAFLARSKQMEKLKNRIKQFWNIIFITYTATLLAGIYLYLTTDFPVLLTLIFLASNLIQMGFGLYEGLTRIQNKVTKGLNASNCLRIMEFLGLIIGAFIFKNTITLIALVTLIFKSITAIWMLLRIHQDSRFLRFGRINKIEVMELLKEGLPFLVIRFSDFLTLSGILLILQKHFSAIEIVAFVTSRTFFRLGLQITSLINHTYSYEMSSAWADSDLTKMKLLIKKSQLATNYLSFMCAFVYLILGVFFYRTWTHQSIEMSKMLLILGTIYSGVLSINQGQKIKFNAINLNLRVSYIQFAISVLLLVTTLVLGANFKIEEVYISLILSEFFSILFVRITTRDDINKHFAQFNKRNFTS